MAPVQILLFVAALFIYCRTIPALEVVLVFITIYPHIFLNFFLENCPKLHACIPNFGHTLICCYRPKLRFCRVTSDTKTCFKKL